MSSPRPVRWRVAPVVDGRAVWEPTCRCAGELAAARDDNRRLRADLAAERAQHAAVQEMLIAEAVRLRVDKIRREVAGD